MGVNSPMARAKSLAAALCAGLILAGCSFVSDVLYPSLSGDEPEGAAPPAMASGAQSIPASAAESNGQPTLSPAAAAPPALGTGQFNPPSVTPGQPTGTFVGQKVVQFRGELQRLQAQIREENQSLQAIRGQTVQHSERYHATVGVIQARLQVGTTPGNPILVSQWNAAQGLLDQVASDVAQMNSLANRVSGTSTLASYLLELVRAAYGLSGAVDEDHRQLTILEDEVNRTVVTIDRLLNELSSDISRQSAYLATERSNLTALSLAIKNGELYGSSLANRAFQSSAPVASAAPAALPGEAQAPAAGGDPLRPAERRVRAGAVHRLVGRAQPPAERDLRPCGGRAAVGFARPSHARAEPVEARRGEGAALDVGDGPADGPRPPVGDDQLRRRDRRGAHLRALGAARDAGPRYASTVATASASAWSKAAASA